MGGNNSKQENTVSTNQNQVQLQQTPQQKKNQEADCENYTPKQMPFDPRSPNVNEPRTPFIPTEDKLVVQADVFQQQ